MTNEQINQCQDDMIKLRREHLDNEIYKHRYLLKIDQLEEEGLTTSDAHTRYVDAYKSMENNPTPIVGKTILCKRNNYKRPIK